MDEIKLKLEDVAATTAATTVIGGGLMWLFREKMSHWVRGVTKPVLADQEKRLDDLEGRMGARETHDLVQAQRLQNMSENMDEGFKRVTRSLERLEERSMGTHR